MAKTRSYLTVPGLARAINAMAKYSSKNIRVNGHKFTVWHDPEVYHGDAATPFVYRMGVRLNPSGALFIKTIELGEKPEAVAENIFIICV